MALCVCGGGKGDGEGVGEGERVHKGPRIAKTILKNEVEAYPTKNKTNKETVSNITCY